MHAASLATHETCLLPATAAIEVTGRDARVFLQAQLTSDVLTLTPHTSQLSAWCNAQGRVITTLRVIDAGEALLLLLPADQAQHAAERLRRFVLRAKVAVETRPLSGLGVAGPSARARLQSAGLPVPERLDGVAGDEVARIVRVAGANERYEVYAGAEAGTAERLGGATREPAVWRLENVRAGLPVIHAVNREQFLPQMLNLDLLAAVSFSKGCYPGQEIVARTQHLGRVKRRMLRFAAHCVPEPGSPIRDRSAVAGTVIEAAAASDGCELLAVVRLAGLDEPLMADGDARPLTRLDLPYAVPSA